jgi:hypothetical protein
MNYFNPYYPYTTVSRPGLLRGLFGNINFSSILSGTSKTLNVVNQAIPIVKQAGPIMKNAKTMFRVMSEFKKDDNPSKTNLKSVSHDSTNANHQDVIYETKKDPSLGPTFFL